MKYERITLNLLHDFQRVGEVCNRHGRLRTDIIGKFRPLPRRWIFSGNIQSGFGLESSLASWEMSFRPRPSEFMSLLGKTQSRWVPGVSREHRNIPARARERVHRMPLSSASNPMPRLASWRLRYSCPLMHSFAL